MKSTIYTGTVRHRRTSPKEHNFSYQVFIPLLDLDELPSLLKKTRCWSNNRPAIAKFNANDFFPQAKTAEDVKNIVIKQVREQIADINIDRVCMLANLRYYGFIFNPIVCYYCFDANNHLTAILAQVTNTPWLEKHCYVIPCSQSTGKVDHHFNKVFHVSPFMPMNMHYRWRSKAPEQKLVLHMESFNEEKQSVFDATLILNAQKTNARQLDKYILLYPLMTVKVVMAIYWQALKLFFRGFRFFGHPEIVNPTPNPTTLSARKSL